jgi:hypothetical protein
MPVSYEASQVLKCTVSFSYQRYLVKSAGYTGTSTSTPASNRAPGVPEIRNNGARPVINDINGDPLPGGAVIPNLNPDIA